MTRTAHHMHVYRVAERCWLWDCPCGGGVHGATQSLPTQRAAFVAAAHQDVPWLLNLVKVLTEDRNDLRDALQEIGEDVVPLTAERDRLYSERNKVLTERLHLTAKRNNLAAESGIAHGFWCESCEFFELDEDLDHNERCIACGCPADDHTSVKVVKELND